MFDEAGLPRWSPAQSWSLASSLVLHGLLMIALAALWSVRPVLPFEEVIPVNLLIGTEDAPVPPPAVSPEIARLEPPAATAPQAAEPMIHATTILSGRALAEPRNRQALKDLPTLDSVERMVQLCNIEALEQVAELRPDIWPEIVTAYATKDLAIGPNTVVADGAAFRVGDDWYALKYRCRLAMGHDAVVAFDFLAGDRLAPARVEELGLAVGK